MDFKLPISSFLPALRRATDVADRKSTMPILANVLLRVTDTGVTIAATDLNIASTSTIPTIGATPGALTVGAKALHDIVANLPGAEVSIKRDKNNWAEIKAGKVSYRIVGIPDRDFPKIADHDKATFTTVDAGALLGMLRATTASICNDETRFHLNGVLFESNGTTARMVSTDGHRLAKADRPLKGPQLSHGVIIPKKGVLELRKLLDGAKEVQLAIRSAHLFVQRDATTLAVKLIDAQFPPYEQVVPTEHRHRGVVARELLLAAMKRAQLMSSETRGVKLAFRAGTLEVSSDNPDVGEVREEVECEFEGQPITIGLNPRYALDLINVLEDVDEGALAIELVGELSPIVFRAVANPGAFVGVVMPMRI